MNGAYGQGRSILANLLSWLVALAIGSIVLQILLSEFVRWVTILAPWAVLLLMLGAAAFLVAAVIRRRAYGY